MSEHAATQEQVHRLQRAVRDRGVLVPPDVRARGAVLRAAILLGVVPAAWLVLAAGALAGVAAAMLIPIPLVGLGVGLMAVVGGFRAVTRAALAAQAGVYRWMLRRSEDLAAQGGVGGVQAAVAIPALPPRRR